MTVKKQPKTPKPPVIRKPHNRGSRTLEEIRALEEPINVNPNKKEPKKRGRARSTKYVSYEEAKNFLKDELITSRDRFYEWWERNQPKDIPKFPYRFYKDEWVSWNDFLGNGNTFGQHNRGRIWRPYEEASMFVHGLRIKSYQHWLEYAKEGKLPKDIPVRPDLTYSNWRTWGHWLGNSSVEAIEAKKQAEIKSKVYYIIHEKGVPENVITFGVEQTGISGVKARWEREHFDIIRLFWYNNEHIDFVNQVIQYFSRPYLEWEHQRIVPNFWEIIYHLEQKFDRVNMKEIQVRSKDVVQRQQITETQTIEPSDYDNRNIEENSLTTNNDFVLF